MKTTIKLRENNYYLKFHKGLSILQKIREQLYNLQIYFNFYGG